MKKNEKSIFKRKEEKQRQNLLYASISAMDVNFKRKIDFNKTTTHPTHF